MLYSCTLVRVGLVDVLPGQGWDQGHGKGAKARLESEPIGSRKIPGSHADVEFSPFQRPSVAQLWRGQQGSAQPMPHRVGSRFCNAHRWSCAFPAQVGRSSCPWSSSAVRREAGD